MFQKNFSKIVLISIMLFSMTGSAFAIPSFTQNENSIVSSGGQGHPFSTPSSDVQMGDWVGNIVGNDSHTSSFSQSPITINQLMSRSSNLTEKEVDIVMGAGRQFDFISRKWIVRPPMTGTIRENFLLSWVAKRDRIGVVTNKALYSTPV